MKKIKLGVIFGGMSTEHDVSIVSGTSIIKNLNKDIYDITPIYIDKNGDWFLYNKNVNDIEIFKIGESPLELQKIENPIELLKKINVAFPVLHGLYGEDGTIQGLFELIKLPYVGCKVLSSSVCMDKVYTKVVLEKADIKQVEYTYVRRFGEKYIFIDDKFNEKILDVKEICEKVIEKCGLPVFVKPSNSGSSVGINKAKNVEELSKALDYASLFDKKIIIEKAVDAQELECAVIGNENVDVSCVGEILPAEEFYSFDAKYNNSDSRVLLPADIDIEISEKIRNIARKAFKAVDGRGLARVDFFVDKNTKEVFLNEINTMPGFTKISMYPQLWEKCGKSYSNLLDELIQLALEDKF